MSSSPEQTTPGMSLAEVEEFAYQIRRHVLRMVHLADSSHVGGTLSCADIVAVLYGAILRVRPAEPAWPDRDRFVLSKGHCCAGLYAALAMRGFFPVEQLDGYGRSGTLLMGHASHKIPGVEWSTGSLGHGLGLACGQALAGRRRGEHWRVFALCSDGEMDEGSSWEAILFAGHHRLSNLYAIIDRNQQQALGYTRDILDLGALSRKFEAFGWEAVDVDGHDLEALVHELGSPSREEKPKCIVAHTVKGKGVGFMEDKMEWHYKSPKTPELLARALAELAAAYNRTQHLKPKT
jgi:transketolase